MIPAVILAAGLSSRMGGRPKALLPLADGRTFVEAIVDAMTEASVADVIVVVGHEGHRVTEHLARTRPDARVVVNAAYETGQFSSVRCGLDAVDRPGVTAMLMTLVDVPLVSALTIRAVLQRFHETGAPVVRPVRGDEHGHPVLIASALFPALRAADPNQGAKAIVRAHVSAAGDVAVDDPFSFRDVDTPDAHAAILTESR